MKIYFDEATIRMTLVLIANNGKDIVIGTDTLTSITRSGETTYQHGHKSILLNKHTAIVYSGTFSGEMWQFIRTFATLRKKEVDARVLRHEAAHNEVLPVLKTGQNIRISFIGYERSAPTIQSLILSAEEPPRLETIKGEFIASGYDGPAKRAHSLLDDGTAYTRMRTNALKAKIESVLRQCIEEYSESETEKLGGDPDIHILRMR